MSDVSRRELLEGASAGLAIAAAVANAIFNATGRRIKSLPITRDKMLASLA